jgi:hypothetical protein
MRGHSGDVYTDGYKVFEYIIGLRDADCEDRLDWSRLSSNDKIREHGNKPISFYQILQCFTSSDAICFAWKTQYMKFKDRISESLKILFP